MDCRVDAEEGMYEKELKLGAGFLEKVYENALTMGLKDAGLQVKSQKSISVIDKGKVIGEYKTDLIVEDKVLLELKAQETLKPAHEAQLINYLKATNIKVGLLINFTHPKATIKRIVF